jgi:NTE family protein
MAFGIVLLREHPHWQAPASFSEGLTKSLATQIGEQALLVRVADSKADSGKPQELGQQAFVTDWTADDQLREKLVQQLPRWQERFKAIVLRPVGPVAASVMARIEGLTTEQGDLLGPGDPFPEDDDKVRRFVVGSGERPVLPILNGSQQLLFDAAESEINYERGEPVTSRFRHTVDSIARHVLNVQIGLACGGGVAWGLAHIGVFSALEKGGLPIDMVTGTSSGALIGGMRCCGHSMDQIREHVVKMTSNRLRLFEWRIWKLHMIRESTVRKQFERAYGDVHVNQMEIPFWANALDVEKGEEVNIADGPLSAAVRASICLPGLFPPLVHRDALLIDASLMDAVPIKQVREMGCRFSIASNVMQYAKGQALSRKYPRNLFPILYRALQACGHEITASRCERVADAIIKPAAGTIPMLGFRHIDRLVQAGERAAQEQLPQILAAYNRLKAEC